MENTTRNQMTLVLGGTGTTGRRVADRLKRRGVPVRIGSRSGEPPFEWTDQGTWAPVIEGVDAVYVCYHPDLAIPEAPPAIRAFTDQAAAAGVRKLVLLSGRGEENAEVCEQIVQESSLDWTVVRASWFAQNFSEGYLLDPVLAGEVALPVGEVPEPFVDVEDIADVAAAALAEDGHAGRLYEVTGPRLLTFAEAVGEIAAATGRDIRFQQVPLEGYLAAAAEQGVPDDVIGLLEYLFDSVLDGRNARLTDGVRQALGREPADFADFARRAAATGVWAR